MKTIEAYLPFIGGTTYGKGIVRKTTPKLDGNNIHKFVFVNHSNGRIYFNNLTEWNVKGMLFTEKLTKKHINIL